MQSPRRRGIKTELLLKLKVGRLDKDVSEVVQELSDKIYSIPEKHASVA